MESSLSKRAINRQRWFERIQAWEQTNLTQKAYCQQHHLGLASFKRWRQLFMTEERSKASTPVTFLPVSVMEPHAAHLTLRINDKLCLEIPAGFDSTTLKQVIQVLQAS